MTIGYQAMFTFSAPMSRRIHEPSICSSEKLPALRLTEAKGTIKNLSPKVSLEMHQVTSLPLVCTDFSFVDGCLL